MAELPPRIVLIGLSGSGKSSVARLVARALRWEWGDSDDLIVSHDGRHIPQIFKEEGEEYFRRLERQAIAQLVRGEQVVIATGGGAVLLPENRRRLWKGAFVVRLDARPQSLVDRVSLGVRAGEARPLLAGDDVIARLSALAATRAPLYALADWTVQSDSLSPQDVAEEVVRAYERYATILVNRPGRLDSLEPSTGAAAAPGSDPDVAAVVRTPTGSYPVVAAWGALSSLGERLRGLGIKDRVSVVSDRTVAALHGEAVTSALRAAGFECALAWIEPGEDNKTLRACEPIYDWLIERRAERGEAVIALGGGVVTDLAGFVAATYLRGVPLVHVPTSLLGAMDAAIGGKVAVDHPRGKNLIGAFYQPRLVLVDAALLQSLPERELNSGWAEVIKHALIADAELLMYLEREVQRVRSLDPEALLPVLRRSVQIKAGVVGADERESSLRSTLNYGHTFGHALEAVTGYGSVLHGEAVAVGMAGAGEISHRLGLLTEPELRRQNALIAAYGLPLTWSGVDPAAVIAATALDKKVAAGAVRWVLLDGIGRTTLRSDVPPALVREVAQQLFAPRSAAVAPVSSEV